MHKVVMGAKGGGGKQRQPKVAKDTTASKTYARLQYGMSEGEVEGLANGLKSVYLDDTPVESDSGAKNFQDLTLDFRTGTNDQTYMEGFESIASESAVGVELKSGTPWVKGVTNLNLDAVIVRVRFGALKQQDPSTGDVTGVKIDYSIEVQADGGTWELALETQMSGKTAPNYERSHEVVLPKANKGWLIRVTRKTPNSTSEYVSDKMYVQAIAELVYLKLAYPNTALIGVQYDAETFSNIAKLAVELKGIKIKVPSNYDPVSRSYVGMWNGLFKRAYTNNPAWIYYDLCTAKRYALGHRLTEQMIDRWSLYRLAQYCDQLVPDGKGGEEPRFTCNVYIQSAEAAFDILRKLAGLFRAINYWDGTSIICEADLPQDTYFTYTSANIIGGVGAINSVGTRNRDRHNAVKVAWDNPQNRYKTEYVFVRDEKAIAQDRTVKMLELEAWGCTSEGQAQRTGQWALKSEQLETQTITFKVGLDGHIPLPGKVIEVANHLLAGRDNGGRISAVSKDRKSITLDRDDVVCRAGDRLVVNGEDGKSQARTVSGINGRVVTVVAAFDSVAAQNIWVVDAKDLATVKYRVLSVVQDEQHQFTITALQHNPAKYDAIDHGAFIDERPISIIQPSTQAPVESVTISSEQMVQQGLSVETMIIGWPQAKDATKYQVEWRKDNGTWLKLPITGSNSAEVAGIYAGKYEARVIAISAFEISSLPTYSKLTELKGKQGKPPKLAFIRATGVLFGMKIDWGFPAIGALDTAFVEINVSPDGKSNIAQLGLFAYPTTTHTIQGLQPNLTQFYQGRLVDRIGNKGDWSNWVSGTSTADAKDVLDLLHEQISESQLSKDLKTKVDHIDQIDTQIPIIKKDIQDTRDQLNQEAIDRKKAIVETQAKIDQEVKDRIQDVKDIKAITDKTNADLAAERQNRIDAINLTQKNIDKEVADRKAAINSSEDGLTQVINQTNQNTLQVIDTLKKSTDSGFAAVQSDMKVISDEQKVLSEKTDGVYAQLNPQLAGSVTDMAGSGEVFVGSWSLQSAMIEGDMALAKRVDTVSVETSSNKASIQQEIIARVDGDKALGQKIDTLSVDFNDSNAAIRNELKVVADKNESTASTLNTYITTNDGKMATITNDLTATTNATNANTQSIKGLSSEVDVIKGDTDKALKNSATAISTAETAASDAKSAASIATQAQATAQSANSNSAAAVNASNDAVNKANKANENSALALSKAEVAANDASAAVKQVNAVEAKLGNYATTGQLTQVDSKVNTLDQKLIAETKRIDGVYAQINPELAGSTSDMAGSTASLVGVWSEQSARIEGDSALGQRIDTVSVSVGENKASIQEERTARIDGDRVTTEVLNSYISSNDTALAFVRQTANTAVNTSSANAETINALDLSLKKTQKDTDKALENSATAVQQSKAAVDQAGSAASMASSATATAQNANSNAASAVNQANNAVNTANDAKNTANTANQNAATALSKATVAANDASAAVQKVDVVEAKLGDYATTGQLTQVDSKVNTVDQKLVAETKRIDGVYAQVNPELAGSTTDMAGSTASLVGVWSEQSARIEGDMAQAKRIDQVSVEMQQNSAVVSNQISTLIDADKALSESISTVRSDFESNKSTVQSQIKTLSDDQSSQANRIDTVQASAKSANTKADNAQSTANDALFKANQANTNLATLKTEVDAVAKESSATVKQVNTMQTTVNGHTASIQEQKQSIDGVYAQQYMKFDVNGHIVGHGSMNDGKTGTMIFNYDAVHFGAPVGVDGIQPKPLMSLQTKADTLPNGTIIPPGLYVSNGYFGRIDASKLWVDDLSAITASFGSLKATAANIEDGAIKKAHIGSAQVDTLQVAGGAITANAASEFADRYDIPYFDTAFSIAEATINPAGGNVVAWFCFEAMEVFGAWTSSYSAHVLISIKRGNTVISQVKWDAPKIYYDDGNSLYPPMLQKFDQIMLPIFDKPPSGSHKYSVEFYISGWGNNPRAYIRNRKFILQGAKR
ncbi:TipJ family phage tail tip protein [Acinetobacter rudis]|uniref:Phage tail protein n=1 Tax=Acinetobacter rudis TaxID=632955 RepID=A0AAW8J9A5_9GAMM|nr:phage tail protein [Acinetobacter rudis]MDQ8936657.1 phage tail protein [Acinetobacter rudis]MDQ9018857.1 phage tail protein [Acinetobacter rudis]